MEMPCGPRRKQTLMPGRGTCGSEVNSTPLAFSSAAAASMFFTEQAEMVEALIGRDRGSVDAVSGLDLGDEDLGAAELQIDARLALRHRPNHLGAEHALEPARSPPGYF